MKYLIYPLCLLWAFAFSACEYEAPLGFESLPTLTVDVPMDKGNQINLSPAGHTIRISVDGLRSLGFHDGGDLIIDSVLLHKREAYETLTEHYLKVGWLEAWWQGQVLSIKILPNDTGEKRFVVFPVVWVPLRQSVTIHQATN